MLNKVESLPDIKDTRDGCYSEDKQQKDKEMTIEEKYEVKKANSKYNKEIIWRKLRNNEKLGFGVRIVRLVTSRLILVIICSLMIGFNICIKNDDWLYLFFLIPMFIIIAETLYICIRRNGRDFKWFSLTAFTYTIIMIICFWIDSNDKYLIDNIDCQNETLNAKQEMVIHSCVGLKINSCELLDVASCFYLIPVVFLRYMTPHSERIDHKTHSGLVVLLLTSAADIIDFFEYARIPRIVYYFKNITVFSILAAFSTIQFSFTLTAVKKIKKIPNGNMYWFNFIFGTETWSIILLTLTQDFPFFVVRSIIITQLGFFVQSSLTFFFLKNFFMMIANLYRIRSLYIEYNELLNSKFFDNQKSIIIPDSDNTSF